MSAPPPYSTPRPTENPDRRPLPHGWITQYDRNYQAWYYVDTNKSPTQSQWNHPFDPHMSSPPTNSNPNPGYQPPPNLPPSRPPYNSSFSQQQVQPFGGPSSFNQPPQAVGFSGNPQEQRAYPTQQQYQAQPNVAYGTGTGHYRNTGWAPNWPQQQQPQPGYIPQNVTQVPQQQTHSGRHGGSGMGMGSLALAGGAGLLGGALLAEGFEHHERHEEREEQEAYDQGYLDGQDNDYGGRCWRLVIYLSF
ncbi:hypothetical protein BJV78DRAFT_235555 [Lactifluus subvellereus]|nr:hypothetical protein BJV78DRAFT_235555 [Lactifluus subvellereus]